MAKKVLINEDKLIELYNQGVSVNQMSFILNAARATVGRRLKQLGLQVRNGSDANLIRFSRMTPEERKQLTKACNKSLKGYKYTYEELCDRAQKKSGRYLNKGVFEAELSLILMELGYKVEIQKECAKYHIDMVIDDKYAIEIGQGMSYSTHLKADMIYTERLDAIFNKGYKLISINFSNIAAIIMTFWNLLPLLREALEKSNNYIFDINYIQIKGFKLGKGVSIRKNIIDDYFNILESNELRFTLISGQDRNGNNIDI